MQEIDKFDVKVKIRPYVLEKDMLFTINNNLAFIESMQIEDSALDAIVKNLSDNGF